jgi:alkanesulfonate monooxygenase SsuD/methylene tetrahydromethanopterin reductase-like flavin-dependent oxidoreductase (luciferase family)
MLTRLRAYGMFTLAHKTNQSEVQMKLGVALPIVDIGGESAALREFAQTAEEIGYHGIAAPDHVLGANIASRPGWTQPRAGSTDLDHDPFVLFGFLAGCTDIADFST